MQKVWKTKNLINVAFRPALEKTKETKGCLGEMQIKIVCKKNIRYQSCLLQKTGDS